MKHLSVTFLKFTSENIGFSLYLCKIYKQCDLIFSQGIVKGKLDQRRRCFEVHFAAGRDLRPGQLEGMIQTLANCLSMSDNLLLAIQEKIKWADSMNEINLKHKKEVEDKAEELHKNIKAEMDIRGTQDLSFGDDGALVMDFDVEDRVRPKRRR
ncbi:hypothetical protein L7F22_060099 [Adiantum nelumboides]|nr:hypothetical protein [Adiantum nelumboides]